MIRKWAHRSSPLGAPPKKQLMLRLPISNVIKGVSNGFATYFIPKSSASRGHRDYVGHFLVFRLPNVAKDEFRKNKSIGVIPFYLFMLLFF